MKELGFKEWLDEQERTDEGLAGRIGGTALAMLKSMGKNAVKGAANTVGGTANTALGVGQALIPGQRAAGAARIGRGLVQGAKGVGQLGISGAPLAATALGMPGADLAVGALAPHIGHAAAGLLPAAVQGIAGYVPPVAPLYAGAKQLITGGKTSPPPAAPAAPAAAPARSTPPPIPAAARVSDTDKALNAKYAAMKARGEKLPFEVVPDDEKALQDQYRNLVRKYHMASSMVTPQGKAKLLELDKMAAEKGWPKVPLIGSDYIPGTLSKPKPPGLPVTSPDMSSPGATSPDASATMPVIVHPDATPGMPEGPPPGIKARPAATVVGSSGRNTKEMSDDEIKAEMERRLKGGDKATAEKLAHVLKRRAEKAVTPEDKAEGQPKTGRERLEWDHYTQLLHSKDPVDIDIANRTYKILRAKYPHVKWPKPPGGGTKTLPDPKSSATMPV